MSDVSKTIPELIAEARAVIAQGGTDSWEEDADVMRRLADALESATRVPEQGEASAAIERVRAIHSPLPIIEAWGKSVSQPDDFPVCVECTDPDNNWEPWPCPTIAALDGAPEREVKP